MSLFGSSTNFICADYFGDELPFPLPSVKEETKKKIASRSEDAAKHRLPMFGSSANVICADYFGDELPLPLPLVKPAAATVDTQKNLNNISSIRFTIPFNDLFSFNTW